MGDCVSYCASGCRGECTCRWKALKVNDPRTGFEVPVLRALIPNAVCQISQDDHDGMVRHIVVNFAHHNKSPATAIRFLFRIFIRVCWREKDSAAVIPLVAILCREHFKLWRTFVFLAIRAIESASAVEPATVTESASAASAEEPATAADSASVAESATAVESQIPSKLENVPEMMDSDMFHIVLFFLLQPGLVVIFSSLREAAPWSGVVKTTNGVYETVKTTKGVYEITQTMYKKVLVPRFKKIFPKRDDVVIKIIILMNLGYLLLPSSPEGSGKNFKYEMYSGRNKRIAHQHRLILLRRVIPMPVPQKFPARWMPVMFLLNPGNHVQIVLQRTGTLLNQTDMGLNFTHLAGGFIIPLTISPPNSGYSSTAAGWVKKLDGPLRVLMGIISSVNLYCFHDVFLMLFRSESKLGGMSVIEYLHGILTSDQNGSLTVKLSESVKLQTSVRNAIGFIAQFLLRYTSVLRLYTYILRWMFIPPEEECIPPEEKCILEKVMDLSKRRGGIQHIFAYTSMIFLIKWRREEARNLWIDDYAGLQGALENYSGNPEKDLEELLRENQPWSVVAAAQGDASASASAPKDAVMVAPDDTSAGASAVAPEDAVVGDKRAGSDAPPDSEDEPPLKRGKREQP